jgi:hypothetical protein
VILTIVGISSIYKQNILKENTMLRIALFAFVAYQLFTLPSGTSLVANGVHGIVAGVLALVIAVVIWGVVHHSDTSFVPFWRKFL